MSKRVCSSNGCPTLVEQGARGGRCLTHQREADKARGTRTERGYGPEHQALRDDWARLINNGVRVDCWRCHHRITSLDFHLGHDDIDRTITRGPEHPHCNLSAAGQHPSRGGG